MSVKSEALKDAKEYARSQMFYGEGAGVRRRLINTSVDFKAARIPGYQEAFEKAMAKQDMGNHALSARKERSRIDRKKKVERNVRGVMNGNRKSLTTSVLVAGTVAYYAHQTGYDKVALDYTKKQYQKGKAWVRKYRTSLKIVKDDAVS